MQIKDSGGTWRNLSSLLNMDWVNMVQIKQDIDSPVATARIELVSGAGNLCISPLNEVSLVNKLSGSYTPLIDIKREIKIEVQLVTDIKNTPSSWLVIFWGYTDSIEFNSRDNTVTINCRDLGARIQDTFIETERTYSNDSGTLVESVMQNILNDNYLSDISLYTPTSPGWYVKKFKQDRVNVLDALQNLAKQIGYSVRYKYDNSTSNWRLTFYCPDRTKSTVDYTFETDKILEVDRVSLDISGIRNVISVWYGPSTNRQQYTASDSTSISKYGRRFMEIKEGATSQIDTTSEATTLANAILNDLKDPKAEVEVVVPFFPFVELGDLYRFKGGNDLFTSDINLAIVSFAHTITESDFETSLICRGKPAGAYLNWHSNNTAWSGARDTTPPATPTISAVTPISGGLRVTLPTPTDADWDGYEIHISDTSGFTPSDATFKAKGKQTSFDITDLPTRTYYVKAISYDTSGNKSSASSEASSISSPSLNPYERRIQYDTFFDSLDGFSRSTTGTAYITLDYTSLTLGTGSTSNSLASIVKAPAVKIAELTWSKTRRFITAISVSSYGSFECLLGIGNPPPDPTSSAMMFKLIGNGSSITLYGYTKRGINGATVQLAQNFRSGVLEALCVPGTAVYFFVNGTCVGTITSVVPGSGGRAPETLFYIELTSTSSGDTAIKLSEYHFVQEV